MPYRNLWARNQQKHNAETKAPPSQEPRDHKVQPHRQHSHRLLDMIPKPVMTQSWAHGKEEIEVVRHKWNRIYGETSRATGGQGPLRVRSRVLCLSSASNEYLVFKPVVFVGKTRKVCIMLFVSFIRRRTRSFFSTWQKQKRFLCLTDFVAGWDCAAAQDATQLAELSRGIVKVSNPLSRDVWNATEFLACFLQKFGGSFDFFTCNLAQCELGNWCGHAVQRSFLHDGYAVGVGCVSTTAGAKEGYLDTSRRSPTLVFTVANHFKCISVQIEHNSVGCHG